MLLCEHVLETSECQIVERNVEITYRVRNLYETKLVKFYEGNWKLSKAAAVFDRFFSIIFKWKSGIGGLIITD